MEVIELPGYTEEEKLEIAQRHLSRKQRRRARPRREASIAFARRGASAQIIRDYTREAGLRNLEREIGRVCRKVARAASPRGRREPRRR